MEIFELDTKRALEDAEKGLIDYTKYNVKILSKKIEVDKVEIQSKIDAHHPPDDKEGSNNVNEKPAGNTKKPKGQASRASAVGAGKAPASRRQTAVAMPSQEMV